MMKFQSFSLIYCGLMLLVSFQASSAQPSHKFEDNSESIIPLPVKQEITSGYFVMDGNTTIISTDSVENEILKYAYGYLGHRFRKSDNGAHYLVDSSKKIRLELSKGNNNKPEGYELDVNEEQLTIRGYDDAGLFYGLQTFLQLLPETIYDRETIYDSISIPCQHIVDYPRFSYRGMMLDVARTFSDKETVKNLLDRMAHHKLNRFHWHLTDDEGWRIEIKSHPELASLGGFRGGDSPIKNIYGAYDRKYGGYFTQEDIKEVVEYAAQRKIEIIPEIDMPGHSRTVARIFPHILCRGVVDSTAAGYDMRNVWCATKETNYDLIEDIIKEISELFPSEYIHLGGDEVPPEQWEACPDCNALMKNHGYKNTSQITSYFIKRVGEIAGKYGKKTAVWNEAVEDESLNDVLVYGWENLEAVKKSLKAGYKTIAIPSQYFYFDMKQSQNEPGLSWAGIVPAQKTYSFETENLSNASADINKLAGAEGAFWTELMLSRQEEHPERNYLEYQLFPRMCVLSEVAWTQPGKRKWEDFNRRLEKVHYNRLLAMGIDYRKPEDGAPIKAENSTLLKPDYSIKSNIPAQSNRPYKMAADYNSRTHARTVRTAQEGDWFVYEFKKPIACSSIEIHTGYSFLPRFNIGQGRVEVSYDGNNYEYSGELFNGKYIVRPHSPLQSIRISVYGGTNGEEAVILQDLVIKL